MAAQPADMCQLQQVATGLARKSSVCGGVYDDMDDELRHKKECVSGVAIRHYCC